MQFRKYTDVHEFYDATYDVLMQHEAQNMILLGNIIIGKEGKDKTGWRDPANWLMATVSAGGKLQLVACMTPPHLLTLYAADNQINETVIDCMIDGLSGHALPGVTTEKNLAFRFAEKYCAANGKHFETSMDQRIYELTKVNPNVRQIGTFRPMAERDVYFMPFWLSSFQSVVDSDGMTMSVPQDTDNFMHRLKHQQLYILEDDGHPVCVVAITRELQAVSGIGLVYTPPYFRGRGYATSATARVSQIALDNGFTKCVLYTDLANPTSNSIYQKIGYQPVCDSVMLKFL